MVQLIFSSEGRPANPSASQEDERDWMIRVVSWPSNFSDLLGASALAGSFGKTFPVRCHQEGGAISETSSVRLLTQGMASRGESWTLSGSESPSDAVASLLSDILETGVLPSRFYLSARACSGILRRAEARGRTLPIDLRQALIHWSREPSGLPEDTAPDPR